MEYKKLNEVDLKLKLLSGSSIYVDGLEIQPYTLKEICDYGYSNYMKYLQWVALSMEDFLHGIKDESEKEILAKQKDHLKVFDFYIKLGGQELQQDLLTSLSMIFRTEDVSVLDDGVIALDWVRLGILQRSDSNQPQINEQKLNSLHEKEIKLIHRDNFDDIIQVVKLQNYMSKPHISKQTIENPSDDDTRQLIDQMKKLQQKVETAKKLSSSTGESEMDLADLISAVSSKSHSLNKFNIWDCTLYQLYDEYARLECIEQYEFSTKAMLAGADKIKLKHWSAPL
ncbi:hypothetical protein [Thermoactinomyces sp. DSM 45892]|uniref:hypothetical protein n=1 Tax=Thermoactinomyces sp. DSM 45892 TaxID=1882753 RepID=UPI00089C1072|nr:hypothetical protein [Thermoactinomyces sp. DSM 45892]SDX95644.1 hypothetical protein SAMN05444416_10198 [Thermoactinomyces sp. DSM 45892]